MDAFRFYLGEGSTAAEVVAALDATIRDMEATTGAAAEITVKNWGVVNLPLITAGIAPRSRLEPPPPRCA